MDNRRPRVSGISRTVDLSSGGAEVDATGIELVHGHGVAQHVDVAVTLRQALGERFPLVATGAAAVSAQLPVNGEVLRVTLDGDNVNGLRFVRVDVDDKAEVGGEVPADLVPLVAGVVGPHHVPMLLHEHHIRT